MGSAAFGINFNKGFSIIRAAGFGAAHWIYSTLVVRDRIDVLLVACLL
jgi:hypothetical protein